MRNVLRSDIITKVLTSKDTEYAVPLPEGCSRFIVQPRTAVDLRLAYRPGEVADATNGQYLTVKAALPPRERNDVSNPAAVPRVLYLASGSDGTVAEIEVWS